MGRHQLFLDANFFHTVVDTNVEHTEGSDGPMFVILRCLVSRRGWKTSVTRSTIAREQHWRFCVVWLTVAWSLRRWVARILRCRFMRTVSLRWTDSVPRWTKLTASRNMQRHCLQKGCSKRFTSSCSYLSILSCRCILVHSFWNSIPEKFDINTISCCKSCNLGCYFNNML